ncbi:MAG: hypothetical protein RR162_00450 [Oscillospiraceae bacterium]
MKAFNFNSKPKLALTDKIPSDIIKNKDIPLLKIDMNSVSSVRAFRCETLDKAGKIKLATEHRKLLTSLVNKEVGTEASVTFDLKMKCLGHEMGDNADSRVRFFKADKPCVVIHNHPTGGTFTHTDINAFARDDNIKMLTVVGNNGAVYAIEKKTTLIIINTLNIKKKFYQSIRITVTILVTMKTL